MSKAVIIAADLFFSVNWAWTRRFSIDGSVFFL